LLGNYFIYYILFYIWKPFSQNNFHGSASCVIFIIGNIGYTFIDACLLSETFKEICRAGRWRGVPKGWWFQGQGPSADVSQSNALRRLAHVSAHVSQNEPPRLSSLCKEAIQITPRLPRPSSQARINTTEFRIDPRDHPSDCRSTGHESLRPLSSSPEHSLWRSRRLVTTRPNRFKECRFVQFRNRTEAQFIDFNKTLERLRTYLFFRRFFV